MELIKAQDFFQSAAHGDTGLPGTDDEYRIVRVSIFVVTILVGNGFLGSEHCNCFSKHPSR